jgi:hypothetical protein
MWYMQPPSIKIKTHFNSTKKNNSVVPQKEEDNQLQRSLPPQSALLRDTVAEQERLSENKFQSIFI